MGKRGRKAWTIEEYRARFLADPWVRIMPEPNSGCWIWLSGRNCDGYGLRSMGRLGCPTAHRFVYECLVGPIPASLDLDHLCNVRCCVNPAHLEPVTTHENLARAYFRRTGQWGGFRKLTAEEFAAGIAKLNFGHGQHIAAEIAPHISTENAAYAMEANLA